jgi:PAS domain S-box-containing protein
MENNEHGTGLQGEELRPFFEMSLDMLCIAGFDGYFKRINPAWERILGYSRDEMLASPYVRFVHPDDQEKTLAEAQKLTAGVDTISFENRYRCKDGSYRWLLWRSTADRKTELLYAAARDITDRKEAEEQLRRTVSELQRSNEELAQFAHVASHDLREPLRMVASFLQLLERHCKDKLNGKEQEYIAYAVDGAKRMEALVRDLLTLSRVQTRAKPFQPVDCKDVLKDALADLQVAIREAGAILSHDAMPTVTADPTQLAQLFQNLLANAIKFRGAPTARVHIGAKREANRWVFSIQDNGIGIDPQYFERIFVVFQRLHSKDEYPGTGIGLALSRKIVERHRGTIWVESEPGKGTTFFFTIPDNKPPALG